jgi:phosphoglycolate phosphatase
MKLHGDWPAAMLDLDGTLVDTLGDFEASLDRVLADRGLPSLEAGQVRPLIGKGGEYLVRSVLQLVQGGAEPTEADCKDALASFRRHYGDVSGKHARVFPGVRTALLRMQARGMRLACVTNKPTGASRDLLRQMGLDGFFAEVTGGDRFDRLKPDPHPLLKTCEALGTEPARTLMIGDSVNDAAAARAAGCPVVLVTYGYNHGEPVRDVDADGWIDSLGELGFV